MGPVAVLTGGADRLCGAVLCGQAAIRRAVCARVGAGALFLPLAPWLGLASFRGRGFCSPNDRRPGRGRGLWRLVRRGGAAVPGLDISVLDEIPGRSPRGGTCAGELDIGGCYLTPAHPPLLRSRLFDGGPCRPSHQCLTLWASGAWFGRMTVSGREPSGPLLRLFHLYRTAPGVVKKTIVVNVVETATWPGA